MYHYQVTNSITNQTVLNSTLRMEFDGYSSESKAHMSGLAAKNDNNLSDLYVINTFKKS